jgi:hypothetical protein
MPHSLGLGNIEFPYIFHVTIPSTFFHEENMLEFQLVKFQHGATVFSLEFHSCHMFKSAEI